MVKKMQNTEEERKKSLHKFRKYQGILSKEDVECYYEEKKRDLEWEERISPLDLEKKIIFY